MTKVSRTVGGDRIGSGKKMTVSMHGYGRSTHNLNQTIAFTQAPGVIYPVKVMPLLVGDSAKLDLSELIRTLPTNGPAFSKFKWQAHAFWCPIRLYNAQLHNNRLDIGMHLEQVKFPQVEIHGDVKSPWGVGQVNPSSLAHYMGIAGVGQPESTGVTDLKARFQGMTWLAYADIYKNFYANKQEGVGKIISQAAAADPRQVTGGSIAPTTTGDTFGSVLNSDNSESGLQGRTTSTGTAWLEWTGASTTGREAWTNDSDITIRGVGLSTTTVFVWAATTSTGTPTKQPLSILPITIKTNTATQITFSPLTGSTIYTGNSSQMFTAGTGNPTACVWTQNTNSQITDIEIETFDLVNIDKMRDTILQQPIANQLIIGAGTAGSGMPAMDTSNPTQWVMPYAAMVGTNSTKTANQGAMNGLFLRTYLNDRFVTWLDTDWIDGEDGITARSAVDTSEGSFTMDSLNLAQKVYNLFNRIGSAGGTYIDYLESAFGLEVSRGCEIPQFKGGTSTDIVFNEVVSMADAQGADGSDQPLGSLGGRGNTQGHSGGKFTIIAPEHGFIIICVSAVPVVMYSQGNKWFNRWDNLRQLHMPELDGIGYQELITDEMLASDTKRDVNGNPTYKSVGKQPSWIEYMTEVNESHGDFAVGGTLDWMVNNRNYQSDSKGTLMDATTYIDPTKFSYLFASSELPDTEWMWTQIAIGNKTKRVMSAKMMPQI